MNLGAELRVLQEKLRSSMAAAVKLLTSASEGSSNMRTGRFCTSAHADVLQTTKIARR
jgi:hypothetical protein